ESIEGLAHACKALKVPIVSGNVSLYNETAGRQILPTPMMGMVGSIDLSHPPLPAQFQEGTSFDRVIYLLHCGAPLSQTDLRPSFYDPAWLEDSPSWGPDKNSASLSAESFAQEESIASWIGTNREKL